MNQVHIELQRVQTWLFSAPRLRAMVGANALLGETLRVALPKLARETTRGWALHPSDETYPAACPTDPLKAHDDPAADAKAGILSRDGGHFEAQFASGAEAFADAAAELLRTRLPGLRFGVSIDDEPRVKSQVQLSTELPVLAPCEWTGRGLASAIVEQGDERPSVSLDVAQRHEAAKCTEDGTAVDIASLLSAATKLQPPNRAHELKELVGSGYLALIHADGNGVGSGLGKGEADGSLFAIQQIVEGTHFLAELHGSANDLKQLAEKLGPVLEGRRWLRVGRAGAPVEVAQLEWCGAAIATQTQIGARLTLTSDLLVRDEHLRWRAALDDAALKGLLGDDVQLGESIQDSVMVHGFNGTSRLWRMPAAAIRRGSVFEISGAGLARLAERAAKNEWLGERTHEGFGRFRIDAELPGVTSEVRTSSPPTPVADVAEEAIAKTTAKWFGQHASLAKKDGNGQRPPSLSQWFDLVGDLEADDQNALKSRLNPTTAGGKSWKRVEAKAILDKLNDRALQPKQRALHARLFVRWLRAELLNAAGGQA